MTDDVIASAPGKAILSGEYAVLDGAPAVVMAVNRRAEVRIEAAADDRHSVSAPGLYDEPRHFRWTASGIEWLDDGSDYGLFEAVLLAHGSALDAPRRFVLDTNAFREADSERKLGFGSSAALAAALAMALSDCDADDTHPIVAAAGGHTSFQGGRGSGADVAASMAGGLIEYRMGESGWLLLDWPEGLSVRFFDSGVASSTTDRIERLRNRDPQPSKSELAEAAERMSERWRGGHAGVILAELRRYNDVLWRFSNAFELDIFAAGHDVLCDAAPEMDVVYKPSGAGGGDVGVAFATDARMLDVFASVAASQGFRQLDVQLDPLGARVSQ